ncbi:MAG: Trm112 family protein [Thermomicrobium sp.]|nr:Trm112 family protein [Thermomicrobium sp.]
MSGEHHALDPELLDLLACPACHGPLRLSGDRLVCERCRRRYRIEDGIPILLVDEAELPPESESERAR